MPDLEPGSDRSELRARSLARWENEGGAIVSRSHESVGKGPALVALVDRTLDSRSMRLR